MVRALAGDSTITSRVPSPPAGLAARFEPVLAVLAPVPFAVVPLVAPLRAGTLVPTSHPRHSPPEGLPCWPRSSEDARPSRYFQTQSPALGVPHRRRTQPSAGQAPNQRWTRGP